MKENDEKKRYFAPEINVLKCENHDVVRTSEVTKSWNGDWGNGDGDYFISDGN